MRCDKGARLNCHCQPANATMTHRCCKNGHSSNQEISSNKHRCALRTSANLNRVNKMEHNHRRNYLLSLAANRTKVLSCVLAALALVSILTSHIQHVTCQLGLPRNEAQSRRLPDLASATSTEPIVAVVGQDAFVSCVAKNLQNYTVIWRYTNDANAPAALENNSDTSLQAQQNNDQTGATSDATSGGGIILTAGRQRVTSDDRFSVIQSHDTWLLKISNVKLADTGTYICHTNSQPRVRALRILSVIKPSASSTGDTGESLLLGKRFDNFTLAKS